MGSDGKISEGNIKTPLEALAPGAPKDTSLPEIAEKADDLEEIKKAVEDAASVSGGLWLSYLFVLSYIAIAAGAVTHDDLLLVRPVKLPFLNVELPLKAFFALAPFVVLIIHAYALMHFIMLGKKASRFHNELRRQFPSEGDNKNIRDKKRWLLPSNIFVQILAGPPELRKGIFGLMLKLIALITLVAFPVLVLLLLQIQFLLFHDVPITWAQRTALSLDILFLWLLRPPVLIDWRIERLGSARARGQSLRALGLAVGGIMSVAALWISIVVATIPGEWQETALAFLDKPRWQVNFVEHGREKTKKVSTHDLLFVGDVNDTTRRRKSWFSSTLVLPGFNLLESLKIDEPGKLDWREHVFDLRGRHLEQAVLSRASLLKADLTGTYLEGASLECAQLKGASLECAQLQGASLESAQLRGTLLDHAQLQGASLNFAHLQGATLEKAQLQGALLWGANLQGLALGQAQLQGASLLDAAINATDFSGAILWRTNWGIMDRAKLGAVRLGSATWELRDTWDATRYAKAYEGVRGLMTSIPDTKMREAALKRIESLDCGNPDKTLASCDPSVAPPPEVLDWQKKLTAASVDGEAYATVLATELRSLVCASGTDAIHILRGVLSNGQLAETDREAPGLVDHIMSKDCPVSASLTDDDKATLLKIKQDAEEKFSPSPASKKNK
jgi:hypothetical protein